jgi:hypothetical protein
VLNSLKEDQALAMLKLIFLYMMFVNARYIIFIRMFYKLIYERKFFWIGFANGCIMTQMAINKVMTSGEWGCPHYN